MTQTSPGSPLPPSELILHLTHRTAWERALPSGRYTTSTRGADLSEVGFIHGSFPTQLPEVARSVFAGDPAELVVLGIDPAALAEAGVPVLLEDLSGAGTAYPHLYGAVPTGAVVSVRRAGFDEAGNFAIGEELHQSE